MSAVGCHKCGSACSENDEQQFHRQREDTLNTQAKRVTNMVGTVEKLKSLRNRDPALGKQISTVLSQIGRLGTQLSYLDLKMVDTWQKHLQASDSPTTTNPLEKSKRDRIYRIRGHVTDHRYCKNCDISGPKERKCLKKRDVKGRFSAKPSPYGMSPPQLTLVLHF
ncbi:hypothetical protein RvY_02850 [Ramazzottius varieornatus]|uniref:Uncharacterized protein n=1 Tax=Ramazzottius varieornatus TaxID=947166 RepID=A0A1D1UPW5_RAMVA|nr:hypothetical protein RvY_02850 [Ramazzottius varieornatus]